MDNNYYQQNYSCCRPPCPPRPIVPPTILVTGATGPQGVMGLQGVPGPMGPTGPSKISAAYLVSFNNYPEEGYEIEENERLPIMRKELDTDGICDLDPNDNTIQFSKDGYYKVTFTVNAYVPYFDSEFDPNIDFVSVAFRLVGAGDAIFIGDSQWIYDESSLKLVGQGIIIVPDIANAYELVNLSKRRIYLNTPDLKHINTTSYFVNAPVTIIVEYLGK